MTWKTWAEKFKEESIERCDINPGNLCTYGIKCLDDANIAIAQNELIVIGASSGFGKSEIALQISRHNAMRGKKVAHFNLEGGSFEAMQRMKWRDICQVYFDQYKDEQILLDYRKWSLNKDQHPLMQKLEGIVWNEYRDRCGDNLYLYDCNEGLTIDDFQASLLDFHSLENAFGDTLKTKGKGFDLDLIILDHLQYFNMEKDENEIQEITRILKTVKQITHNYHIPVVLISHLRKLPRDHGIPDKEDLYGSGNVHKIANTVIILASDTSKDDLGGGLYPTFFRIAKSRIGLRNNILLSCNFDIRSRSYQDPYCLYKVNSRGEVTTAPILYTDCPDWYDGIKNVEIKNTTNIFGEHQ